MSKCRLCLKEATLCNSHVIPEFIYEQLNLYDEKHRFNVLSTKSGNHPTFMQKGIREKLLCKLCEEKLSKWEKYARQSMYGGECIEVITINPGYFEFQIDYAKFKLFQLSILWRVGLSTNDAFASVKLGNHEDVLRRMLFEETPGSAETYGCVITYSTKHTNITSNTIDCLGMVNFKGILCVGLMLGSCFWLFFLSDVSVDFPQSELLFQENGHLRILVNNKDISGYIESLAKDIRNANPARFDMT